VKELTASGQTVEEAVQSALGQLGVTLDQVETEVLEEGKKGFFGFFGRQPAVVKVTVKPQPVEEVKKYLSSIAKEMNIELEMDVTQVGKQVNIHLKGEKIALLIGKRGQTLNALQQLAQLVANRFSNQYLTITLDAENYRGRRTETLNILAERMAAKALRTRREIHLEPLPSFERKIIHAALAHHKQINTYSEGTEPNRYIVIAPKKGSQV